MAKTHTESCAYDLAEAELIGSGDENIRITRLSNVLSPSSEETWAQRSDIPVSAQATFTLLDGTGSFTITSAFKGDLSFKALVLQADKQVSSMNATQKYALAAMYEKHYDLMSNWELEQIPNLDLTTQHYCICGRTTDNPCADAGHTAVAWQLWTDRLAKEQNGADATAANSIPTQSGNYYLQKPVSLSEQTSIPEGQKVSIDTRGNNITSGGRVALVYGTLNLTNTTVNESEVSGSGHTGDSKNGATLLISGNVSIFSGVTVTADNINGISRGVVEVSGVLNIYGGKVEGAELSSEKTNAANGSAIVLSSATSKFYINKGSVTGTDVTGNGGAIYMVNGTAEIAGTAKIIGSNAAMGGAIYMESGSLTLSEDCTVSDGYATEGANIFVNSGTFTMNGGTLPGGFFQPKNAGTEEAPNYPALVGCNVYLAGGTFTMTGGQIKDAIAYGNGSNLYVGANASATLSGGSISGGFAIRYYKDDLTAAYTNDTVARNGGNGGNIYCYGSLTITGTAQVLNGQAGFHSVKDGAYVIADTTKSQGYGGNILLSRNASVETSGRLTISGDATISGGKSAGNGGNMRVDSGSVTMSGDATISGGQSINDRGGNIWLAGSASLELTGGKITEGTSKSLGGNIHSNNGGTLKLLGGTIEKGTSNGSTGHITANVSALGANTKLTLGNVTIPGGICANLESAESGTGFVKLTGNPQIQAKGNGLDLKASGTLKHSILIENLDATARVQIRSTSSNPLLVARGELSDAAWLAYEVYVQNFVPHNANYDITFESDGIYMRKLEAGTRYSCACGADRSNTKELHVDGCTGYDELWKEWNVSKNDGFLPTDPGNWYLTGNLTTVDDVSYIQNVGQTTFNKDFYEDAEGVYHPINSVLALNTAGSTITTEDGTYVSVAEYNAPAYTSDVGGYTVPYAYVDASTNQIYTKEEAAAAGITPVKEYEIRIDLNGMKLETKNNARIFSFRGAQTVLTAPESEDSEKTREFITWRQAKVTVSIIDSSEGHTGCMASYGTYTKGQDGKQLFRHSGTQYQGAFIWMPSETIDTLNTYYINMNASTIMMGTGAIYTSGTVNLWHSTLTGGTAQGFLKENATIASAISGGGALTIVDRGNVTMHGGTIQNGTSIYRHITAGDNRTYDRSVGGGNVCLYGGTFTVDGGTITGGRSLVYMPDMNPELKYHNYGGGGGVYVISGELILKGNAQITGNTSGIINSATIVKKDTAGRVNALNYLDVTSITLIENEIDDNVFLGGHILKVENFTGNVCYNTGKYIQSTINGDYAGSLVSSSGNCNGTLTRENTSGVPVATTGNSGTYLVGYGIADIQPTPDDLKAGVIMTNYGNQRDTSTLYAVDHYDIVKDESNFFGTWDTKLYATALATTDGDGDTVLVLSLDCSTFQTDKANTMKRLISGATGVPVDNITISCAHQHSAPPASKIYAENEDGTYTLKTNYALTFYSGVLKAALAAMADRKQATVSVGTLDTTADGHQYNFVRNVKILSNGTHVGMTTDNHLTHYQEGGNWYKNLTYAFGRYTTIGATPLSNVSLQYETDVDTTMQLVRYSQVGGSDIIMANFQTHPHLGSGSESCYVHSDVVGAFRHYLAENTGCHVMYFSGGGGNVNPTTKIDADTKLYSYASSTLDSSTDLLKKLEKADLYGQSLANMAANFLKGTEAYTSYNGNATKTVAMRPVITADSGSKDVKASVRNVVYQRNTSSASQTAIRKLVEPTTVLQEGVTRSLIDWSTGTGEFVLKYSTNNEIWGRYVGYSSTAEDRIFSIFHARNIHEMLMWKEAGLTTNTITITAYALGEIGFVAAPYEMFQESGSDIKNGTANSQNASAYNGTLSNPFAMTIVATQANGGNGYIPSSLAFDNGGYSTDISNFAKGTAELLVTNYLEMLNNLK